MASAMCDGAGRWRACGPRPVPEPAALVENLFALAKRGPTLAAFDFPIGFPAGFGERSGFGTFQDALDAFGAGRWPELFAVASAPDEVGPRRPFYPDTPGGRRLQHLLDGHRVASVADLIRDCERAGPEGGSAGCMFWTVGAKQVGKAALSGWRDVVAPAFRRGARIWPFDGDLAALAAGGGLTLAESYPGDAYGQLGFSFERKSKRRIVDRAGFSDHLLGWAATRAIALDDGLREAIRAGFPATAGNDDGFDAVIGLLAAVAVARRERHDGAPATQSVRRWEGWILACVMLLLTHARSKMRACSQA